MNYTKEQIKALADELEKRAATADLYAEQADTITEKLKFVGYKEAYALLAEELKERGELVQWQD